MSNQSQRNHATNNQEKTSLNIWKFSKFLNKTIVNFWYQSATKENGFLSVFGYIAAGFISFIFGYFLRSRRQRRRFLFYFFRSWLFTL